MQTITLLGATGSIGVSTLDVIARHPDKYSVFALTAHTQIDKLAAQCQQFNPQYAVVADQKSASRLQLLLSDRQSQSGSSTEVLWGRESLCQVASDSAVDTVMAAIVGAAGLVPTLAAVEAGKKILLANKESLVMAGGLFIQAVADSGSVLLPIDSEHNAIFQCLPWILIRRVITALKNFCCRRLEVLSAVGLDSRWPQLPLIKPVPTPTGVWVARYRLIRRP